MKKDRISITKRDIGFPHEGVIYTISTPHQSPYSPEGHVRRIITGSFGRLKGYLREEIPRLSGLLPSLEIDDSVPEKGLIGAYFSKLMSESKNRES